MNLRLLLTGIVVLAQLSLLAQHGPAAPDTIYAYPAEVVVTAQRQAWNSFKLPGITTVLKAQDLKKQAARTVPEALQGMPGIFLQKTNHGGGSAFLRGLTGQQTLLLVDGVRLNNATFRSGPNQYLNTLDPAWVGRIEVMQGSGSVEYGSDAIGGVIQVLTHQLSTSPSLYWQPEASFKWMNSGMETSVQAASTVSGPRWALRTEAAYRNFGDLIAGRGIGRQTPTGYTQWSYAGKGLVKLSRRLTASFLWQDLEQQHVPLYHKVRLENFSFNEFEPQRRNLGYVRLSREWDLKWARQLELTASRQYLIEGRTSQKNNQTKRVDETDKTLTHGLQLSLRSDLTQVWQMQTGLDWYTDAVRSNKTEVDTGTGQAVQKRGLYPDRSRMNSLSAYNLHTFNWPRLSLSAGVRYQAFRITIPDENIGLSEISPSAWVGNLGASWALNTRLRLFAAVASAFRAPNIDDLGTLGIVDFRYELPNQQLSPEKSRSAELGLKWSSHRGQARISGYYLALDDLIGRISTGDTIQSYPVFNKANIAQAYVKGLEAQFKYQLHRYWHLVGHGSYTFGQNLSAHEPLRRIPPFNGRLQLSFVPKGHWEYRLETLFATEQNRLAAADKSDNRINPNGTPGWQIVNLGLWYRFKQVSVAAELHNLFNEAYRTHGSGVDGLGRSCWIRVYWQRD